MKIKKGDTVKIIVGKDKGKSGKVTKVIPQDNRVLIDGLNLFKKSVKPKKQGEKGQIVSMPRAINSSNVMMVCPNCKNAVRVGYIIDGDDKKRICKKCQSRI